MLEELVAVSAVVELAGVEDGGGGERCGRVAGHVRARLGRRDLVRRSREAELAIAFPLEVVDARCTDLHAARSVPTRIVDALELAIAGVRTHEPVVL